MFQWDGVSVKAETQTCRQYGFAARVIPMSRFVRASLLLLGAMSVPLGQTRAEWVELDGCRLVNNSANDGDSFHVMHGGREYVFRLYFVDAPETSELIPSRVGEQAEAFRVAREKVLKAGKRAGVFTSKNLNGKFRVTTRWEDARGMTAGGRHYAFVETDDGEDLGELLLAAGWARSYGMKAATKTSTAAQLQERYDRLEKKARRARVGIWGGGAGSVDLEEPEVAESEKSGMEEDGLSSVMGSVMDEAMASAALAGETGANKDDAPPDGVDSPPPSGKLEAETKSETKSSDKDSKIDINTATKEELTALPGIGEKTAEAIIAARPFAGSFDLLRVTGVTPATLKQIYPYIRE